jgi:hypothetical protein
MQIDSSLQVVASAVTPVVLVSATAILISGVNSRHMAIADRIRALTSEYRDTATTAARLSSIAKQLLIFERRVRLVSWAIRGLFVATGCFIAMALIIGATQWRKMLAVATLPLFLTGILLIMFSIACILLELHDANRSLFEEIADLERR